MKQSSRVVPAWRQGVIDSLPITVSIILFGAIYGMLSLQAGLTGWQSLAMSTIVYAGAAQFTALSMLSEGASMWAIILATFLLNSRHLLMGLSVSPHYQNFSMTQVNIFAFLLTDEQYAIILNRFRHHSSEASYILSVGLSLFLAWNVGTLLGVVAGQWIPDPESLGLGFSFTAMFLALAYYQLTSVARILTFIICAGVSVSLTLVLPSGLHLLAAGLVAFGIGYYLPVREEKTNKDATLANEVETA